VLRIIVKGGLFNGDGRNKVKVSLILAMLDMLEMQSLKRSSRSVGSRKRKASTMLMAPPA
jgi:hypothetical protein